MVSKFINCKLSRLIILLLILFAGCEYDTPADIYPIQGMPNPVISQVTPDSAINGIIEIKVLGQNFSAQADQNFAYFETTAAIVKSATENELHLMRPLSVRGSLMLKVVVRDAFSPAEFGPYYLEDGLAKLSEAGVANSIAVDGEENLYYDMDEMVYKVSPGGESIQFGTTDFFSSCMRIGPDDGLYIQKRDNVIFFRIGPEGGAAERYAKILRRVSFFDFDAEGYIYSGGERYGLMITTPDGATSNEFSGYQNQYAIKAIRVYNNYVYVVTDTIEEDLEHTYSRIWKHEIKGNGKLRERNLVYSWTDFGDFAEASINDLTFSEDGAMYLATDHANPICIIHPDGTLETLFPGSLPTPLAHIYWGPGNYLYLNQKGDTDENSGVFRLIMGKKGAVYWGGL